jgi:hypothetical protein
VNYINYQAALAAERKQQQKTFKKFLDNQMKIKDAKKRH